MLSFNSGADIICEVINPKLDKGSAVRFLAKHFSSATMYSWLPLSADFISKELKISYYKCLKLLHELRDEGLVVTHRTRFYEDYSEKFYFAAGWVITEKGEKTDIFKEEEKNNLDYLDKAFSEELWER